VRMERSALRGVVLVVQGRGPCSCPCDRSERVTLLCSPCPGVVLSTRYALKHSDAPT